jgi:IclR family KDG regulon transcriptional repressor
MRVLNKAVRIVDLLAASTRGIRLKEVAYSLRLNKATALRILRALESHSLVRRDCQGCFFIGNRILWWEAYQRQNLDFLTMIRSTLDRLRELTSETATFSVSISDRMVVVDQATSFQVTSSRFGLGTSAPLTVGASGKVILAHMDRKAREKFLKEAGSQRLGPQERKNVEAKLEQYRKRGVAVTHGERDSNTTSIAAPILGPAGEVLGVISVNGPSERLTPYRVKEIASLLLDELARLTPQFDQVSTKAILPPDGKLLRAPVPYGLELTHHTTAAKVERTPYGSH